VGETGGEHECDWAEKDGRQTGGDSDVRGCWESAAAETCKRGLRRTATGRGVVTEGAGAGGNDVRGAAGRRRVRGAKEASGTGVSGNGGRDAGMRSGVVGGKT
jgi:hypothetical protein